MAATKTPAATTDQHGPLVDLDDAKLLVVGAKDAFQAEAGEEPKADEKVEAAFRIGWHMAELTALAAGGQTETQTERLPTVTEIDPQTRMQVLGEQIEVDLAKLRDRGVLKPEAELISGLVKDGARPETVATAHHDVLVGLAVADYRFAKAYSVGIALSEITLAFTKGDVDRLAADLLSSQRVETIARDVSDLKDSFARYAAFAVGETLRKWQKWIEAHRIDDAALALARDQARIWRALLSGEKPPKDLLRIEHYTNAAIEMAREGGRLARAMVWHWRRAVVAGLVLFGGVAYLLVRWTHGDARGFVAVATLIGGLGISWKGIGATLGRALARAEKPLWDAAIGTSIGAAALRCPTEPEQRRRRRFRRGA